MKDRINTQCLLWKNISELPYFRGFLRSVEGKFFQGIEPAYPALDLGCGDGHFSARTFSGIEIQGVDLSIKSLTLAKKFSFYQNLICACGDNLPYESKSFRTIISNSVLEHIQDVDSVIKELSRIIQPGGLLIVTVPNSNFSKNLSIAVFLEKLYLFSLANFYRRLFNKISRHFHPDPSDIWLKRITNQGFEIKQFWNYFSPKSLKILEWGHFFGLPSLINFKIFGKWVINPKTSNLFLRWIYFRLYSYYEQDQKSMDGAYSFIIAEKQ